MGQLQTFFYLALIGGLGVALWLLLVGIGLAYVVRGLRAGEQRLTMALVGGALLAVLTFVVLGVVAASLSVAFFLARG
ncbi:MAG TPA: hypothetical protein VFD01_02330 [Candidatus Dormibacteraeota bacterium]|jgi:hypothetical protein|nr:hypothetical protein [Candidatus Dormibacteraeota bacterium]